MKTMTNLALYEFAYKERSQHYEEVIRACAKYIEVIGEKSPDLGKMKEKVFAQMQELEEIIESLKGNKPA